MVAWLFYWGKGLKMKKVFIATGIILAILVVTSLQSLAEENVIYGCANKTNGQLRVVSSPNECRQPEVAISWNVVGPQGPQGEIGPQGETGLQGPIGSQGPQGEQGLRGDKGDTGATGPQGERGLTGEKGDKGDTGAIGPPGEIGPEGSPGEPGKDGIDGLHCWDLDANGECDLEEDKNDDNVCDATDCQGPPGIGAIQVFDANDQYLGIRLTGGSVFLPNIKKIISIERDGNCNTGYFDDIWYKTIDCSGIGYTDIARTNYVRDAVLEWEGNSPYGPSRYYGFDGVKFHPPNVFYSWRNKNGNYETCTPIPNGAAQGEIYVQILEIPEDDIYIDFPVEFPLRYEIE